MIIFRYVRCSLTKKELTFIKKKNIENWLHLSLLHTRPLRSKRRRIVRSRKAV
eukprot:UN24633